VGGVEPFGEPLETSLVFQSHPTEVTWEEYAFGRLSEKKIPPLEEHLLACESCQASLEEVTEYIRIMKAGLVKVKMAAPDRLARVGRLVGPAAGRLRGVVWATALAAGSMSLWSALRAAPPAATVLLATQVLLASIRGGDVNISRALSGKPLHLRIHAAEVPTADYRLEVVTASGTKVRNCTPKMSSGTLSVHLPQGLAAGFYWVRLYNRQSEMLAEFGLRVE
jgi:hypothetical protein